MAILVLFPFKFSGFMKQKFLFLAIFCLFAHAYVSPVYAQENEKMFREGIAFLQKNRFSSADSVFELCEKKISDDQKKDSTYARFLLTRADLKTQTAQYEATEIFLKKVQEITAALPEKNTQLFADFNTAYARLFLKKYKFSEAADYFAASGKIIENLYGKTSSQYADILVNIGFSLMQLGKLSEAENDYLSAKKIYESNQREKSRTYAELCNSLASLYRRKADFSNAESYLENSRTICRDNFGTDNMTYAQATMQLGTIYSIENIYKKAQNFYEEAAQTVEKLFGKNHPNYIAVKMNLALVNFQQKNYEKAEELFKECKNYQAEKAGKKTPHYAGICLNMANLYQKTKRNEDAKALYTEAKDIQESIFGKNHPDYAMTCNNLGRLLMRMKDFAGAEALLRESLAVREKLFSNSHYSCVETKFILATLAHERGNFPAAYEAFKDFNINNNRYIKNVFPSLAESEKYEFLAEDYHHFMQFTEFLTLYWQENKSAAGELYNQVLFKKSMVFSSVQKMQKQVLASRDSTLIKLFFEWKNKKSRYVKLLQKTSAEPEKDQKARDEAENDIIEIERKLSKSSQLFAQNELVPTWEKVQEKLKKNELAVEIVRLLRKIESEEQDTVYIALIISGLKKSEPQMITLGNGAELENKFLKFYKNSINFQTDDRHSYNAFWKPLEEKFAEMGFGLRAEKIQTVYFSSDGVYHQISLPTLRNPSSNKYLLEEQKIILLSSTRDLLEISQEEAVLSKNYEDFRAYLLGYPAYQYDNLSGDSLQGKDRSANFSDIQRIVTARKNVTNLPGTKTEIENIGQILSKQNLKFTQLLEKEANEENLKMVNNPTVVHIATHGFFIRSGKKEDAETLEEARNRNVLKNAFMRSGLLLAGCETAGTDKEDGILTAEEATILNLESTELIVLSACETGLGDVESGEGVFGLQRAFRQAGAKTVVMSLWKVSDKATQELMTEFYREWTNGKKKSDAFRAAQLFLKEKYPSPYYWGAFVMNGF